MRPQPRALTVFAPLALTAGLALGAYACDSGTFSDKLPVYDPDAGPSTEFDAGAPATDGAVVGDAAIADAAQDGAGGDASTSKDAGDASTTVSEAGATDAGAADDAGDASTELDADDTGG